MKKVLSAVVATGAVALLFWKMGAGDVNDVERLRLRPGLSSRLRSTSETELPVAKTATPETAAAGATPPGPDGSSLSLETRTQLAELARVSRKAFMSDDEKVSRAQLLKDEKFLREIAGLLSSRELDQVTKREQYQAIDTLLEADASGSAEAKALLAGVVRDAQVENEKLPHDVRENLAGIKAEVLFNWSSQDQAAEIAPLLPGPVSRQLWANVQDSQEHNQAESRTLER